MGRIPKANIKFNTVIFEKYKSLNELIAAIEKREANEVFKNQTIQQSEAQDREYRSFSGSNSYFEASQLMKTGYREPLDQMKRAILKIEKKNEAQRRRTSSNYVGYAVNVGAALQGNPKCMIKKSKQVDRDKTIHLMYGFSAIGNVKANRLIQGGVMFISLVNSLEKQGYKVKIDIIRCTTTNNTAIGYICNVKEYAQPMNLLKLCFPLVHPSMLRRISFKWCETLPNLEDRNFFGGYGASLIARLNHDNEQEKLFLRENGILKDKNSYYCNVYEAIESKDVNELARKMGLVK